MPVGAPALAGLEPIQSLTDRTGEYGCRRSQQLRKSAALRKPRGRRTAHTRPRSPALARKRPWRELRARPGQVGSGEIHRMVRVGKCSELVDGHRLDDKSDRDPGLACSRPKMIKMCIETVVSGGYRLH
jgi:hypothetical protein